MSRLLVSLVQMGWFDVLHFVISALMNDPFRFLSLKKIYFVCFKNHFASISFVFFLNYRSENRQINKIVCAVKKRSFISNLVKYSIIQQNTIVFLSSFKRFKIVYFVRSINTMPISILLTLSAFSNKNAIVSNSFNYCE